ncbi:MAG: FIG00464488: hypothetical protein [uncultured Paraburkholderia sp.]|nr:MAG: FIG00464488: hypothetical protein [uncultured Paraburkholderia sp.]CAH2923422.1 MAG: FIG00464488: hypothetical protein [uncultured Paraburkholderia sp.]
MVEPARPPQPAPLVEVVPAAPQPGYHWVKGHYRWEGNHWAWVPGHWRGLTSKPGKLERPGAFS